VWFEPVMSSMNKNRVKFRHWRLQVLFRLILRSKKYFLTKKVLLSALQNYSLLQERQQNIRLHL
jgi:hypothetical protein